MGEIKSTLELVMAKTSHLSQTGEEKAAQAEKEARDRMRGLLQRFEDGGMSEEELKRAVEQEPSGSSADRKKALLKEALERVGLEKDLRPMAVVLEDVLSVSSAGLEKVLTDFEAARRELAARSAAKALLDIGQRWEVSGTAVAPNLEKDPAHAARLLALVEKFEKALSRAKAHILAG